MSKLILALAIVVLFVSTPTLFAGEIVAWGRNDYGQCNVPSGNNFIAIAGGHDHSLALKSNGSLAVWGLNNYGQSNVPIDNDFVDISAGCYHSIALKLNDSLVAWGHNSYGQIDNLPTGNDFVEILGAEYHALARKSDGSLIAWGNNTEGQCDVPTGNNFTAIAGNWLHHLALKNDGSLAAWGLNNKGQCNIPVGNNFIDAAAGEYHSIALKSDGSIIAWGNNSYGQLDNIPIGNDFVAVAAGAFNSFALKMDGSLVAWGLNNWGQCNIPSGNDFVDVVSGYGHGLALSSAPALPDANANGHYMVYVGDTLTLDANGSTNAGNDIVSYLWDLDDDGVFETDAGGQAIYDVNYSYLESLELLVNYEYTIGLKITDSENQSDTTNSTLIIIPKPAVKVAVDIKPGDCPNPVNTKSSGVLSVAILGSNDYDITTIDSTSIRLAGVEPFRSGYEDVAASISDSNDCNCIEVGLDGLYDLTLKFETQAIVKAIGDVNNGDMLELELTGVLYAPIPYETPIEGQDCILIKGKYKAHNKADINKDGVVNAVDFAIFSENWLQSSIIED